jgi:hypothetical protein
LKRPLGAAQSRREYAAEKLSVVAAVGKGAAARADCIVQALA